MIWLTWRQFRPHALIAVALLVAVAVALAVTGPPLRQLSWVTPTDETLFYAGATLVHLLPALIGAFWGAPLIARELETGTHRLAWNQGVTRTRWLAVKLTVAGSAAVAASGLLSLAVTWWAGPLDALAGTTVPTTWWADATVLPVGMEDPGLLSRVDPRLFGARGVAPIGYAAFAFMVGVAAGAVIRRTVPAMAVTLAVVALVQLAVPLAVRPHLLPAEQRTVPITAANVRSFDPTVPRLTVAGPPGAWLLANDTLDARGRPVTALPAWTRECSPPPPTSGQPAPSRIGLPAVQACFAKLSDLGYRQRFAYHPLSAFWPLQWVETVLFLVLSALLAGFCLRWTRHRLP
ncbi:ABC transporter permease subunit [Nonomuraea sp. NPDC049421]|uniref:ABC transporter permease subunit n=1 Tax=Nonomuraea sp. NPDC049421 TaxID=3155275 RepID=UPI0034268B5B